MLNDEGEDNLGPIRVDRALTIEERRLAICMLDKSSKEVSSFLRDLDAARVVSECSCGCGSIDFAINGVELEGIGLGVLGDFMFGKVDSKDECNVFIFERGGRLAGIEFVWMYDDAEIRIPEPEELISY